MNSPFIPYSLLIIRKLNAIKDRKAKNAFLGSVMDDNRVELLNEGNGHKTTLFKGSKGPKTSTWEQTKQMAFELNEAGIDVAFLPEHESLTSTDSLLRIGNIFKLADFKYCVTVKSNTLAKQLEHGFTQANTIVLKLTQMDAGQFVETIDYLVRNEIPCGNIILMNKYGKSIELPKNEIKTGLFRKKVKGFL
jgi:hypothetical protein